MRFRFLLVILALAFSSPHAAMAQDTSNDRRIELANELAEINRDERVIATIIGQMLPLQMEQIKARAPNLTAGQIQIVEQELTLLMTDVMGDIYTKAADLFAETFTEQELEDILAFYKTPTGQKQLKVMPDLMQRGAQLGMQSAQQRLPGALQKLEERLRERGIPI